VIRGKWLTHLNRNGIKILSLNTGQEDTGVFDRFSDETVRKEKKRKEEVIRSLESSNPIAAIARVYRSQVGSLYDVLATVSS
jgi:hypothetical protein